MGPAQSSAVRWVRNVWVWHPHRKERRLLRSVNYFFCKTFYTIAAELKQCYASWQYVCASVHALVLHGMYDYVPWTNDDLEAPSFTCMVLTKYVHMPIFIRFVFVLDLHFQGQIFKSSTLGVHMWISRKWRQIGQTLLLPKQNVACGLSIIYIWPCPILKVGVNVMHILTANISQMVTDWANTAIANKYKVAYCFSVGIFTFDPGLFLGSRFISCTFWQSLSCKRWKIGQTLILATNRKSHVGFRLVDLNLTLAYS